MSQIARLAHFRGYRQALDTWCWAAVASSIARHYQAKAGETDTLPQCHYVQIQHPGRACLRDANRDQDVKLPFADANCAANGCAVRDRYEVGRSRLALADKAMDVFESIRARPVGMGELVAEINTGDPVVIRVHRGGGIYHLLAVIGYDLSVPALMIWDPAIGERAVAYARLTTIYGEWTHTVYTKPPSALAAPNDGNTDQG